MTVAMLKIRLSSHVAAMPIACGNTVASPDARDAVQRFVPPVVGRHAESIDRRRDVLHLLDLLLERHAADEIVDARLERKRLILVGQRLRAGATGERDDRYGQNRRNRAIGGEGERVVIPSEARDLQFRSDRRS